MMPCCTIIAGIDNQGLQRCVSCNLIHVLLFRCTKSGTGHKAPNGATTASSDSDVQKNIPFSVHMIAPNIIIFGTKTELTAVCAKRSRLWLATSPEVCPKPGHLQFQLSLVVQRPCAS